MRYVIWIVAGYLSGSVLYGYYLPLWLKKVDVCMLSDDGNPGTANAFKLAGIPMGILVILCELGKGFLPVWLAARALETERLLFSLVLAAPVLGHAFPVFTRGRRGGKAIAVSFGVLLGLVPEWRPVLTLVFFYLLFTLVIVVNPHLYRSIITFICFNLTCLFTVGNKPVLYGCMVLSLVVVVKHLECGTDEPFSVRLLRWIPKQELIQK